MAEPTPSTQAPSEDEAKPKLVAIDPQAESPQPTAESTPAGSGSERKGSRIVTWVLAGLLLVALIWAFQQSQQIQAAGERNALLGEQIQALEVQLSAATLQIQTFEMKQELIRTVAADLADRVNELKQLVNPSAPTAVETEVR
jgi:hypothetical protein